MSLNNYQFCEIAAKADDSRVLFFALHGPASDETRMMEFSRKLLPDAHHISIRGNINEFGEIKFFTQSENGEPDEQDLQLRTTALSKFIKTQVNKLSPSRVVGIGYSNGADMLASVSMAQPNLFDDIVLLHPSLPIRHCNTTKPLRLLVTAGLQDKEALPAVAMWSKQSESTIIEWHFGGHEVRENEIVAAKRFLENIMDEVQQPETRIVAAL